MGDVVPVAVAFQHEALGCHAAHQRRRLLEAGRHRFEAGAVGRQAGFLPGEVGHGTGVTSRGRDQPSLVRAAAAAPVPPVAGSRSTGPPPPAVHWRPRARSGGAAAPCAARAGPGRWRGSVSLLIYLFIFNRLIQRIFFLIALYRNHLHHQKN